MKRQRATVIVEIDQRILLVENRGGLLLLPGGGIQPGESSLQAASRELFEETRLVARSMLFLFDHESPSNCHAVFWAAASGTLLAGDDATALHLFVHDDPDLTQRMSLASRLIIDRFLGLRRDAATLRWPFARILAQC
ncbi:MAG: NUDIX domain-containing protein [Candidatus Accumulibacter sp.]|uniref:NUDIX domain-containing protein n=1 Tax=Accumulibacter sp. TaxID=2053492 RepID=UPI001A3B2462|nr:NUDIX domain-containing protein [Accumulibacter sp.]MBL8394576.1 NUDIX domain-containing protein [Accumulibacter sp.]